MTVFDRVRSSCIMQYALISMFVFLWSYFIVHVGTLYSYDAIAYISAAESLVTSGNLIIFDGTPLIHWPPLTSFLIAPAYIFSIPVMSWLAFLYSIALSVLSVLTYVIINLLTKHRGISFFASIGITLWIPILRSFVNIWSEAFYLIFFAGILISLIHIIQKYTSKWFYLLIIFSTALTLSRYSGLFVIVSVSILLITQTKDIAQGVSRAIIYFVSAALPMAAWLIHSSRLGASIANRSISFSSLDIFVFFDAPLVLIQHLFNGSNELSVLLLAIIFLSIFGTYFYSKWRIFS